MEGYLLLRGNVETGPFTLAELMAQDLKSTDLVWVEGRSAAWRNPGEISELQKTAISNALFTAGTTAEYSDFHITSKGIFVALPPQNIPPVAHTPAKNPQDTEIGTLAAKPERFRFRKTFSKPHGAAWLAFVFVGLLLCATLVKELADAYDATAGGSLSAAVPVIDRDDQKTAPEQEAYQNALTKEVIPIDTATMLPLKKPVRNVNLKKLVNVEANDYQVGLPGGIKHLRLLVTNKSGYVLDNVTIVLNYLNSSGEVVKTENLFLRSVLPKSSKSLSVPANKRGVKIDYHITEIQSKQSAAGLVNL